MQLMAGAPGAFWPRHTGSPDQNHFLVHRDSLWTKRPRPITVVVGGMAALPKTVYPDDNRWASRGPGDGRTGLEGRIVLDVQDRSYGRRILHNPPFPLDLGIGTPCLRFSGESEGLIRPRWVGDRKIQSPALKIPKEKAEFFPVMTANC